jgi:hypothetical protein
MALTTFILAAGYICVVVALTAFGRLYHCNRR